MRRCRPRRRSHAFPLWLVATHYLNILFLVFLARSGLQILGSFPRFYLEDGCTPGREIFKFTKRPVPGDRLTTSLDQEVEMPAWVALPGGHSLGIGRHWHLLALLGWILTGAVYVVLQGWSAVAEWSGVPMAAFIERCRPLLGAR